VCYDLCHFGPVRRFVIVRRELSYILRVTTWKRWIGEYEEHDVALILGLPHPGAGACAAMRTQASAQGKKTVLTHGCVRHRTAHSIIERFAIACTGAPGASCLLALLSRSDKAANRAIKQIAPHTTRICKPLLAAVRLRKHSK
jgi:hypothetical protein